jgi:phosphotransferase system enzyme I (PtsI)
MSNDAAGPSQEKRFHGVGVSPGIARGTIFVYRPEDETPALRRIEESEIPGEIARFEAALIATRAQILEMQQRIAESICAKDDGI